MDNRERKVEKHQGFMVINAIVCRSRTGLVSAHYGRSDHDRDYHPIHNHVHFPSVKVSLQFVSENEVTNRVSSCTHVFTLSLSLSLSLSPPPLRRHHRPYVYTHGGNHAEPTGGEARELSLVLSVCVCVCSCTFVYTSTILVFVNYEFVVRCSCFCSSTNTCR